MWLVVFGLWPGRCEPFVFVLLGEVAVNLEFRLGSSSLSSLLSLETA